MVRTLSARGKSFGVTGRDMGSNCLENAVIQTIESSNEVRKGKNYSILKRQLQIQNEFV
jgi:hypothetical protein